MITIQDSRSLGRGNALPVSSEHEAHVTFSDRLREIAKTAIGAVVADGVPVRGIGLEGEVKIRGDGTALERIAERISTLDQGKLSHWLTKLKAGALVSALLGRELSESIRSNAELVEYLKKRAEPGDILFVAGDGKGQPVQMELFDNVFRALCAREERDKRFPFTHVMVVGRDKQIVHITSEGVHRQSFEEVFLHNDYYDAVAVARLGNASFSTRVTLAEAAENYLKNKAYNLKWLIFDAPIGLIKEKLFGLPMRDNSARDNRCVCIDAVTEPARALAALGIAAAAGLVDAATPLQLFSSPALSIVEAVALFRN
jgi:hypothetical protein